MFLLKILQDLKSTVDIKTEIKKPDIKLVGKIDLEKTLQDQRLKNQLPPKEEPVKKAGNTC